FWTLKSSGGVDIVAWGLGNDLVVPGDYDGDGKTDYAIVREGATPQSNLVWWIRNSSGGTSVYNFGITGTDYPVQNDYDGDGKTDVAIWRDPDGTWWVQGSSAGGSVTAWGQPSDYPVPTYDTH
ncbi:MAG TPA: VCBS repeat-containing protein, partial [Pyrinomonadaceae bacterium]